MPGAARHSDRPAGGKDSARGFDGVLKSGVHHGAFGLTTRNDAPIRSSTKSTSEPANNGTEAGSTAPRRCHARSPERPGPRAVNIEFVLEAGAAAALGNARGLFAEK
jgi:hypothetical protein